MKTWVFLNQRNLRFLISTLLIGASSMRTGGTAFLIKISHQNRRFTNQKYEEFRQSKAKLRESVTKQR